MKSDFWTYVIFFIVIFHFVVGFGYLMYKLSPKKGDKKTEDKEQGNSENNQ